MKMKRYLAPDMRRAMRQVREKQGPDAVILSSKRLKDGVEVIAAIDYDTKLLSKTHGYSGPVAGLATTPTVSRDEPVAGNTIAFGRASDDWSRDPTLIGMKQEVTSLRKLLESQLASLAWDDKVRRHPVRTTIARELTRIGLSDELATSLAYQAGDTSIEAAYANAIRLLRKRIRILGREVFDEPGAVAIVGPTGVGKTTTIAKLAARYVLKHGADNLSLLTTDGFRIGAQEQLITFGRILGVAVQLIRDSDELCTTLDLSQDKQLTLIDSAGMSQRDQNIHRELATIAQSGSRVRVLLALPANAQAQVLEETVLAFKHLEPIGCVLTKVDEAACLGGVISTLVRHDLPLAYITDGQNVPEDLHWAGGKRFDLIERALELKKADSADLQEGVLAHA